MGVKAGTQLVGSGASERRRAGLSRGFTLLEVLIAMTILAMGLGVIAYANSSAMTQISRVTRMTTASFLMESVVNDIQEYYVKEGFPSNDIEDRTCELPNEFEDVYQCRYTLQAMDLDPSQMQELIGVGMQQFTTGMGALTGDDSNPAAGLAGLDVSKMTALTPLFGSMSQEMMNYCGVDLGIMTAAIGMVSSYMPQIIDQIAKKTRKLMVTLSWQDGPRKQRDLKIETFVVSLPEEERKAQREQELARENAEAAAADGSVATSAPSFATGTQQSGNMTSKQALNKAVRLLGETKKK